MFKKKNTPVQKPSTPQNKTAQAEQQLKEAIISFYTHSASAVPQSKAQGSEKRDESGREYLIEKPTLWMNNVIELIRKNQLKELKLAEVKKKEPREEQDPSSLLKTLQGHRRFVHSLAVLPNGQLASGSEDSTIKVWDTTSGACVRTLTGHRYSVNSLAVLPNGKLASGSADGTIKVWDTTSGVCIWTSARNDYNSGVLSLAVLPNGQLASGSEYETIKVWDTTSGACIRTLTGHRYGVWSLAVLPNGQLASGSEDRTIKVWDTTSGACVRTLTGHSSRVRSLAVLPNGQLASGSEDRTIKVWDTTSGACVCTLTGHSSSVNSLAMLPNGQLASGSWDETIKVWDTTSGACIRTLTGHSSVHSLAVLPNGQLASGSEDRTIKMWDMKMEVEKELFPADRTVILKELNSNTSLTITMLDLSNVHLDQEAFDLVLATLYNTKTITMLNLANTGLEDERVRLLIYILLLNKNLKLTGLNIDKNKLSSGVVTLLQEQVRTKTALVDMDRIFTDLQGYPEVTFQVCSQNARQKSAEGDIDGAIAFYDKAIVLNQTLELRAVDGIRMVYLSAAQQKEREGDIKGKLVYITKLLKLNNNDSEAFIKLGQDKEALGDFVGAIEAYSNAINIKPSVEAYFRRAVVVAKDRPIEAASDVIAGIFLDQKCIGNIASGIISADAAKYISPLSPDVKSLIIEELVIKQRRDLVRILRSMGLRLLNNLIIYDTLLKDNPMDIEVLIWRGQDNLAIAAQSKLREQKEICLEHARKDFGMVLEIDPSNREAVIGIEQTNSRVRELLSLTGDLADLRWRWDSTDNQSMVAEYMRFAQKCNEQDLGKVYKELGDFYVYKSQGIKRLMTRQAILGKAVESYEFALKVNPFIEGLDELIEKTKGMLLSVSTSVAPRANTVLFSRSQEIEKKDGLMSITDIVPPEQKEEFERLTREAMNRLQRTGLGRKDTETGIPM